MAVIEAPQAAPCRRSDRTPGRSQGSSRGRSAPALRRHQGRHGSRSFQRSGALAADRLARLRSQHILRDTYSSDERPIEEWEEFASFAEQSQLNREIVAEKKAIEQVVVPEAQGTRAKTFIGIGAMGLILASSRAGTSRCAARATTPSRSRRTTESTSNPPAVSRGKARKRAGGAPEWPGRVPVLAGGMSCERRAPSTSKRSASAGQGAGRSDRRSVRLGAQQRKLHRGCGTPGSMHVNVCAAVQNGHAVGVTVTTEPPNGGIANCIRRPFAA